MTEGFSPVESAASLEKVEEAVKSGREGLLKYWLPRVSPPSEIRDRLPWVYTMGASFGWISDFRGKEDRMGPVAEFRYRIFPRRGQRLAVLWMKREEPCRRNENAKVRNNRSLPNSLT